jgi:hypothetical protein
VDGRFYVFLDSEQLQERRHGGYGVPLHDRWTEKVDQRGDDRFHLVQESQHRVGTATGFRERYLRREVALRLEIGGKVGQRTLEAPSAHFTVTYEAVPFCEHGSYASEWRHIDMLHRVPGWIDETVLVRDVDVMEGLDHPWDACSCAWNESPDRAVAGVKWLEFANPLSFARAKKFDACRASDLFPFGWVVENRKLGASYLVFGEGAALAEDRKLNDKMIERCSEIVDGISEDETPIVPNGWKLLGVKDVLASLFVSFGPETVRVIVEDRGNFRPQFLRVSLAAPEFCFAPVERRRVTEHRGVTSP